MTTHQKIAPLAELDDFAKFAHMLADAADEVTLPLFRNIDDVDNKLAEQGAFDPVTIADQNAEKAIRKLIEEYFPHHGILGEEFGTKESDSPYQWIIDPIDGTRAFISGIPMWGTLIGLTFEGRAVFGLNSQPHIGERFWGYGRSAYYQGPRSQYKQITTSTQTDLSAAIAGATAPEIFETEHEKQVLKKFQQEARLMRFGGDCYFYCLLANGGFDIVVEACLNAYDIAALIPIVEAAGGYISDWEGNPIELTAGKKVNVVAAANKELHQAALSLTKV